MSKYPTHPQHRGRVRVRVTKPGPMASSCLGGGLGCERGGGHALRRRRSPPLRIAVCEIAGLRVAASGTPWSRMRAAVRGL